ncbi:DUF563 domain-containing protein [Halorubrum sp. SP9]|uniref:glycosyltransferase family 61 protein n=1 Tax=Halorubrum sp. SP9 TaxID=1537267 RepID=UPI0010F8B48E|nr:glycosyltransferase family 61 protein [Halorubrum sp. SP9]TKX66099.1 glycosyltransferase family 61 protein [Halorubrum sp. SP9]
MRFDVSYWKRLAANSVATAVDTPLVRSVLDGYISDSAALKERSVNSIQYSSQRDLRLTTPENVRELPDEIRELIGDHRVSEWSVHTVQNANIVGPSGLTVTPDNTYTFANALDSRSLLARQIASSVSSGVFPSYSDKPTSQIDLAVSLTGPWSTGFFHWFAEYLPRLEGVRHFESVTGEKPTVIIPNNPPDWLIDSVSLLGFESDRIVEWSGGRVAVDRLIVPEVRHIPVQQGYIHDPFGIEWVGQQLRENVSPSTQRWPSRVYISRDDADERRVVNETQVVRLLEDYGFSRVILSNLSLAEQIVLFYQADVVIGPHGAGLLNAVYSEDVQVIEIFGDYRNACYYTMSGLEGISYACIIGEQRNQDIRISPDTLQELPLIKNQP